MFSINWLWDSGLIHRDLKPENVLIWENPANNNQVLMKWADFGLSKRVNERRSHSSYSGVKGTCDWIDPELLQLLDDGDEIHQFENEARKRGTIKSDVFSEGLVFGFYYFLTGTYIHLFGSRFHIQPNIISNQPVNLPSKWLVSNI
jgi:serine/threonine protein kinase